MTRKDNSQVLRGILNMGSGDQKDIVLQKNNVIRVKRVTIKRRAKK